MFHDEKATIRRFLSLAAVALGLGTVVPDDGNSPAEESVEVGGGPSVGDKAAHGRSKGAAGATRASYAMGIQGAAKREPRI